MRRRYPIPKNWPLPKIWLMTDPRIDDLDVTIARLPKQSGIIFRHYELPKGERRALFKRVKKLAKRQRHLLVLADRPIVAWQWGADGAHDRSPFRSRGIRTVAVHSAREAALATRIAADLIFVSPVFETRSHPRARGLGRVRLGLIAGKQRTIALGGMTAIRAKSLSALKIYGWAAIDAFRI
jgi:thiamine-phosphate pyrophosphorylase